MTRKERARKLGIPVEDLPDGRGRHGNHVRGADHPRYNNGVTVSDHGYLRVQVGTGHPLADPNGYAYVHHLVWFSSFASRLDRDTLIHHCDEDKLNNRIGNLDMMSRQRHGELHIANRERDAGGRVTGGAHPGTALEDLPEDLRIREFPAGGRMAA